MKLNLYQYVILLHPKMTKEGEFDGDTKMVKEPTTILAADEKQAGIKIAREIPDQHMNELDRMDIVIRPF